MKPDGTRHPAPVGGKLQSSLTPWLVRFAVRSPVPTAFPEFNSSVSQRARAQSAEVCDGFDNDCNGKVDDNPIDVGKPCGNDMSLPLPCKAGKTVCQNGKIVCSGAVGPQPEVCNGKDENCDGLIDNGAPCPPGFV